MNIFANPLFWEILGVLLGVCSFFLVMKDRIQKPRKRLSYQECATSTLDYFLHLLNENTKELPRDVKLYEIQFRNTGNTAILRNEFETPILIRFFDEFKEPHVLHADFNGAEPWEIVEHGKVHFKGDTVSVDPLLLNSNDNFRIKAFVADCDSYEISARVQGIHKIEKWQWDEEKKKWNQRKSLFVAASSILAFIIGNIMGEQGWYAFWRKFLSGE